ncbi:MAG: peptide chain release factor N(5)-glutamine methyltransferase [Candidatus Omnitrophota bacterium]
MNSLEQLACWAFDCNRAQLYLGDYKQDEGKNIRFRNALERLGLRVPLQYIMGEVEFMELKFYVSPSVFIPRPETEILVEGTIKLLERGTLFKSPYILDVGTGSGNIAVSLTKYNPFCKILASDISKDALKAALVNAKLNGVSGRIKFVLADLFCGISERERFDLIISNPPYIPSDDYDALPLEVKYEPKIALDGGYEGSDFYKVIIPESARRLRPNGYLVLEIGYGQAQVIRDLIDKTGAYYGIEILKDYNGIDRVIFAKKRAH